MAQGLKTQIFHCKKGWHGINCCWYRNLFPVGFNTKTLMAKARPWCTFQGLAPATAPLRCTNHGDNHRPLISYCTVFRTFSGFRTFSFFFWIQKVWPSNSKDHEDIYRQVRAARLSDWMLSKMMTLPTPRNNPLTLEGSFSSVSKPIFASKYAFFSIFRDLQDSHTFAPFQIQKFDKFSSNFFVILSEIL